MAKQIYLFRNGRETIYLTLTPEDRDLEIAASLESFIKKLNDESVNGALVVVEGQRDMDALRALGFKGPIIMLSHNQNLVGLTLLAEKYGKTILLLDFDRKGRILSKKAATILQEKKVKIDLFYRRELAYLTKGRVVGIQELIRYRDHLLGLE